MGVQLPLRNTTEISWFFFFFVWVAQISVEDNRSNVHQFVARCWTQAK